MKDTQVSIYVLVDIWAIEWGVEELVTNAHLKVTLYASYKRE